MKTRGGLGRSWSRLTPVILVFVGLACRHDREGIELPNIILILADDLGPECVGVLGGEYRTPVLDRLARKGLCFTACYSQPLCTPSRVQLMTGRYNHRNYRGFGYLDPAEVTFANLLRERGYTTCVAGKWQLNGIREQPDWDDVERPGDLGFDEHCLWKLTLRNVSHRRYGDPTLQRNGEILDDLDGEYGPDIFCDFIVDFIEENADRPFFVYYPMVLPHRPFWITPDSTAWRDSTNRAAPNADGDAKLFPGMVRYLDKNVGRIVAQLEALGLRENTIILFTSDNGTDSEIVSSVRGADVPGGKGSTTNAGTHVPLIVSWPGGVSAGECDDLVDFSDFLPTLCELAGASVPADLVLDGRTFAPQIMGHAGDPRAWVFCHYWRGGRDAEDVVEFVRDQRFKLYGDGTFFDLRMDATEETPLTELNAEAREAMHALEAALALVKQG